MSSVKRCRRIDAGTLPRRNPGSLACFWKRSMTAPVSRVTTSAGTSTSISRVQLSLVSVAGKQSAFYCCRFNNHIKDASDGGSNPARA
jgi:hypothetical protein